MSDEPTPVVVDTNILFSALLQRGSRFSEVLLQSDHRFYVCESVIVELFRRKEKIIRSTQLPEEDLAHWYHGLLRRITLHKEDLIAKEYWNEAWGWCRDVDETDTPHVALTLALEGLLWSGDRRLREGLEAKGFTRFFLPQP